MRNILTVPNPLLRRKAERVGNNEPEIDTLVAEMLKVLNNSVNPEKGIIGVGLAATQLGVSKRIVAVRKVDQRGVEGEIKILVNPEIVKESPTRELGFEGCLSVPDTYGQVERALWIKVRALNEKGQNVGFKAEGFFARIVQHELDHLDGILFTDKTVGRLYSAEEFNNLPPE